jgi:hypothetical protein
VGELRVRHDESGMSTVHGPGGSRLATVAANDWETRFFQRSIGRLTINAEAATDLSPPRWREAARLIAAAADAYRLVQAHLDIRHLPLAPALEQEGFRLVDTRISFVTRLDRRRLERLRPPIGAVRFASAQDLPQLLSLAQRRLTDNPAFHSRYKDPSYFTAEETARWFAAWVENDLADPRSQMALWEIEGRVVGFFGYQRQGENGGLPFYKSTVAAVEEELRGQKAHLFLQTPLFEGLSTDEFWVQNTTQLTNSPIIHNNLVIGRRLDRIELTFFRTPAG